MPWLRRLIASTRQRRDWACWAWPLALSIAALLLRVALQALLNSAPFLIFLPVVLVLGLLWGWRQGVVAELVFALASVLMEQRFSSVFVPGARLAWLLAGFLVLGTALIVGADLLGRLIWQLDRAIAVQASLYRELQHRVANNMQFIATMLEQGRRDVRDPAATAVLEDAADRVVAISRLQRRLYDNGSQPGRLENLLQEVLDEAFHQLPVTLELEVEAVMLGAEQTTALVLLVSEAATNAAKHVFRLARGGRFQVRLHSLPDGHLHLSVRDDGPGLGTPPAGAEHDHQGLDIMRGLASQLGGKLEIGSGPGAGLAVTFAADGRLPSLDPR